MLTGEKARKIEALCQQVFRNKAVLNSGKIQFLNFDKLKDHMGGRWKQVEPIILGISEDVITKYVDAHDIYFRYNENDYMIIFTKAAPEEAQLKCQLIASEIKRLIFEQKENYEVLQRLDLNALTVSVSTTEAMAGDGLLNNLDRAFEQAQDQALRPPDHQPPANRQTVIEPPEEPGRGHSPHTDNLSRVCGATDSLDFFFIPLLNLRTSEYKKFIIITNRREQTASEESPLTKYHMISTTKHDISSPDLDCAVLEHTLRTLSEDPAPPDHPVLLCPVHFETLYFDNINTRHRTLCRKIPAGIRPYLHFAIFDIPEAIPFFNLSRIVRPLTEKAGGIHAFMPFYSNRELPNYTHAGITGIGILVPDPGVYAYEDFVQNAHIFIRKAKTLGLQTTALINRDDGAALKTALKVGFDYVGGDAIRKAQTGAP